VPKGAASLLHSAKAVVLDYAQKICYGGRAQNLSAEYCATAEQVLIDAALQKSEAEPSVAQALTQIQQDVVCEIAT